MSKILLTVSIFLLSVSMIFLALVLLSPEKIQSLLRKNPNQNESATSEMLIIGNEYSFGSGSSDNIQSESIKIRGVTTGEPTPKVVYQQIVTTPTNPPSGIPEGGWGDGQAPENPTDTKPVWSDFKDKEAYCRATAESVKNDPEIEKIWRDSYQQLLDDFAADPFSSDPLAAKPPTWEQYSNGYQEDAYNSAYRQCINNISQ